MMNKEQLEKLIDDKINEIFFEYQKANGITSGDVSPEPVLNALQKLMLIGLQKQLTNLVIESMQMNLEEVKIKQELKEKVVPLLRKELLVKFSDFTKMNNDFTEDYVYIPLSENLKNQYDAIVQDKYVKDSSGLTLYIGVDRTKDFAVTCFLMSNEDCDEIPYNADLLNEISDLTFQYTTKAKMFSIKETEQQIIEDTLERADFNYDFCYCEENDNSVTFGIRLSIDHESQRSILQNATGVFVPANHFDDTYMELQITKKNDNTFSYSFERVENYSDTELRKKSNVDITNFISNEYKEKLNTVCDKIKDIMKRNEDFIESHKDDYEIER